MSPVIPSAGRVRALLRRLGRTSDEIAASLRERGIRGQQEELETPYQVASFVELFDLGTWPDLVEAA